MCHFLLNLKAKMSQSGVIEKGGKFQIACTSFHEVKCDLYPPRVKIIVSCYKNFLFDVKYITHDFSLIE